MGCGKKFDTGNCVCDVLLDIADAQDQTTDTDCITSCEQSIRELLGGMAPTNFNTVPFQLLCACEDEPFTATGYVRTNGTAAVIESSFFRVDSIDEKDCCAVLELLIAPEIGEDGEINLDDFERTGACITVDLKCFCGVVCLPAVYLPSA
ncbi:spore coat protein [Bacillus shivajii]|uniref:CotY/CotZ family spore coat protein n=1 Tax=Bacillus shivajii TaxID=1983719 RepID=UPI001CF93799|nr:CotY/CotZ family spore coat protein [Bacillus shivajii]UCZ51935.1 spore coat protein [Bacillus shivajii]